MLRFDHKFFNENTKNMKILIGAFIFFGIFVFIQNAFAAAYYVDGNNGSDDNRGLSISTAKKTITAGIGLLGSPGDILIVGNGYYTEKMIISASGNASGYLTIQAETDGGVVVDGNLTDWNYTLRVTGDYIKIKGFKFSRGGQFNGFIDLSADHTYIKNCGFIGANTGTSNSVYSEVFHNSGTYGLIEDCWFAGGGRYVVNDGGGSNNVYRRCVARWDYSGGTQPIGGFMNYHQQSVAGGRDAVYQNCIAIDFNDPVGHNTWLTGGFADKYGHNITRSGCIAMNIRSSAATGSSASDDKKDQVMIGFFDEPSQSDGRAGVNSNINSISIDCTIGFRQVRPGFSYLTNFTSIRSSQEGVGNTSSLVPVKNCLFYNNGAPASTTTNISFSHFENETAMGANSTTGPSMLIYSVRAEDDSPISGTGENGANRGATVLFKVGKDGAHYGDTSWDITTDNSLWPWPNEERIKEDFRSVLPSPAGSIPLSNNSNRGFCAEGKQLNGVDDITLTSYIWEYLGNPVPPEIYGSSGVAGDLNSDGKVDITDIQACVNHVLGAQDWGAKADVNSDGSVNVIDVQEIVNVILA